MDIALLILRIVAGVLFAGHGAQKLFGWFGGPGLSGTARTFESIGLRPGRVHAGAAGFNEFAGGLLLAAGLLVPLAGALIIATMTAAVITVHAKNGPWVTNKGWELNALYGVIAFAVVAVGPGGISLDHTVALNIAGLPWALGSLAAGLLGGVGAVMAGRAWSPRGAGATPNAGP